MEVVKTITVKFVQPDGSVIVLTFSVKIKRLKSLLRREGVSSLLYPDHIIGENPFSVKMPFRILSVSIK